MLIDYILPAIVLVALLIIAFFDIKYKKIPSVMITLTLFMVAFINYKISIPFGILAGIFGLLMFEFAEGNNSSFGIADVKILAIIGFMITSILHFVYMMIVFAIVQLFYIGYYRMAINKKGEMPFVPALVIVYILTWIVGGFA
jgi:prepilin signal peptidase PulO-like enzyme (type II secretory pathway)